MADKIKFKNFKVVTPENLNDILDEIDLLQKEVSNFLNKKTFFMKWFHYNTILKYHNESSRLMELLKEGFSK